MTETRHGQPNAAAGWQQQIAGLRRGAVRVRRKLGRVRRALRAFGDDSSQVALYEETRSQLERVGTQAARLRTEVDALAAHLQLLTTDVARSEWEQKTGDSWALGNPYLDEKLSPYRLGDGPPFPAYSTPVASDFSQPRFLEMCRLMGLPPKYHRKLWEWTFILHELIEAGVIKEGSRGLGFGVGIGHEALVARGFLFGVAPENRGLGQGIPDLLGPRFHEISDGLEEELLQHQEEHEEIRYRYEKRDRKVEHDFTPGALASRSAYLKMRRRATTSP